MNAIQMLLSTTAGAIMALALIVILTIICIVLAAVVMQKNNDNDYYDVDNEREIKNLHRELTLARHRADQYDALSYLIFTVLYDILKENEASTANHRLTVLRSAHTLLSTDLREGALTVMQNINSDDPDINYIMQYMLSIMEVHGGYKALSDDARYEYRDMQRIIVDLQDPISVSERYIKAEEEATKIDPAPVEEEEHIPTQRKEKRMGFKESFLMLIDGLRHPNLYDYDDEEDEYDDD